MSKKLYALAILMLFGSLIGCNSQNETPINLELAQNELDEFTAEAIPEYLHGIWWADRIDFAIKIEPDGSIKRIIHHLAGPVNIEEGGVSMVGPDEGTHADFVMGPCQLHYDPDRRNLSVEIIVDYFIMQLPHGALEGNCEDYFTGIISEDGEHWTTEWRHYGHLENAEPVDREYVDANPETIVFTKREVPQPISNN